MSESSVNQIALPVLELEGPYLHALPGTHRHLHIRSKEGILALRKAKKHSDRMITFAPKDNFEPNQPSDHFGCLVRLIQDIELSKSDHKVIFSGLARCRLDFIIGDDLGNAVLDRLDDTGLPKETEALAIRRSIAQLVEKLVKAFSRIQPSILPSDVLRNLRGIGDLSRYIDFLALSLAGPDDADFCHEIVEEIDVEKRSLLTISFLSRRLEESKIDSSLRKRVKKQMERSHTEFHLSEQAKAIQEELEGNSKSGLDSLREQVDNSGMSKAALEKCETEIDRLTTISPVSPEHSVLYTYVETLAGLPWQSRTETELDIQKARKVLDDDHYGMEKVKDRIMEYLAVQRRVGKPSGSVMCFVGPPGVGKTSLGKSIASATGREFVRTSLGGVHEEAAIRGHRRTYVASMPGRIIKAMTKANVRNPVFMLDEFDKMTSGYNYHGDPAAALLEVLDPEQNSTFVDQYIEVEFDLSEVLFITTANTVEYLPAALRDRLEIISLPGYTDDEKLQIARKHLVCKQVEAHGLKAGDVSFSEAVIKEIVSDYTHEAGVRELERNIARICRKVATERVMSGNASAKTERITKSRVRELLEVSDHYAKFSPPSRDRIGYVNGLVYGRGLCPMEAVVYKTVSEQIEGTGVTKGSVDDSDNDLGQVTGVTEGFDEINVLCEVARTLMKARHDSLGLAADFAKDLNIHINLPHGAGRPYGALGVSMYALLASTYTKIPVKSGTAMLGEVNLRGDVISSEYYSEYKVTVMEAHRNGIKRIVMPYDDSRLIEELPAELTRDIEFILVRDVEEALSHALVRRPSRGDRTRDGKQLAAMSGKSPTTSATVAH